jgi:8-oxo-dGTP pyrophosphatase MutT (NUDIX family)
MTAVMRLAYNDALRGQLVDNLQSFAVRPIAVDGRKHAAVALTVIDHGDGLGALVLTKRSSRLKSHAGQWAIPGGRIDPGETPEQGALRELHEEVGLQLGPDAVMGRLDDYVSRSGYVITPVVVWGGPEAKLVPNEEEVRTVHRVSFSELDRPGSPLFVTIPESDRPVVQLLVYDYKIHAPTAAIVYQFREVVLKRNPIRVDHLEQPVWAWR